MDLGCEPNLAWWERELLLFAEAKCKHFLNYKQLNVHYEVMEHQINITDLELVFINWAYL